MGALVDRRPDFLRTRRGRSTYDRQPDRDLKANRFHLLLLLITALKQAVRLPKVPCML
jgi:hypothetical protein